MKGALFLLAVAVIGGIGWIMNVVKLVDCNFEPSYKAEVIRGIGVFVPPVGAIAGYITIED